MRNLDPRFGFMAFLVFSHCCNLAAQPLEAQFQGILDSMYQANKEAIGIVVHVESPDNQISWSKAVGFARRDSSRLLDASQPLLIASNTKTYVAAAILKLVEEEKLKLDQPIAKLLKPQTREILEGDNYDLDQITIRHLLSHTSGIYDYVDEAYFKFVQEHPQHQWSRDEQIARTASAGEPMGPPGVEFSYGDINYLLLTEIIEQQSGKPFYQAMRELLKYEEIGLHHTWFESLEEKPKNALLMPHQYSDKNGMDSYEFNTSWDLYGGGGIAATARDAALFYQALFEGKIIGNEEVLREMYTYVLPVEKSNYCLGLRNIPFENFRVYYHGGFWGTDVIYSPETNSSIAVFTLQKDVREAINPFLGKRLMGMLLPD